MVLGAAFPVGGLYQNKFWLCVSRIDNVVFYRGRVCACPPPVAGITEAEDSER